MEFTGPGRCLQLILSPWIFLGASHLEFPSVSHALSPSTGLLKKPSVVKNQDLGVCERKRKGTIVSNYFQSAVDRLFLKIYNKNELLVK